MEHAYKHANSIDTYKKNMCKQSRKTIKSERENERGGGASRPKSQIICDIILIINLNFCHLHRIAIPALFCLGHVKYFQCGETNRPEDHCSIRRVGPSSVIAVLKRKIATRKIQLPLKVPIFW
jgi:hypothetical protein